MASSHRIISRARIRSRRFAAPVAFHSASLHGGLLLSIRAFRRIRRPVYADKIPICCWLYCDKPIRFAIRTNCAKRNYSKYKCSQCYRFRPIKYRAIRYASERSFSQSFILWNTFETKQKQLGVKQMLRNGWRRCRCLRA